MPEVWHQSRQFQGCDALAYMLYLCRLHNAGIYPPDITVWSIHYWEAISRLGNNATNICYILLLSTAQFSVWSSQSTPISSSSRWSYMILWGQAMGCLLHVKGLGAKLRECWIKLILYIKCMQNIHPDLFSPNVFLIPHKHGNNHCNKFCLEQTSVQNKNNKHHKVHP